MILGGLILFVAANLGFALIDPPIADLTLINKALPGFHRFPAPRITLEKNGVATVTSEFVTDLDILFASHVIAGNEKPKDEYRVLLIGDSTVWGSKLELDQTLAEQINQARLTACDGRRIAAYNLGYPGVSAIKDMMILSQSVENYRPDQILWFFTTTTLVPGRLRDIGFSVDNYGRLRAIEQGTGYDLGSGKHSPNRTSFMDRTLVGRRNELAYLLKLYMFDLKTQAIGADYLRVQEEEEFGQGYSGQEGNFFEFTPRDDLAGKLDLDFLRAGKRISGGVPLIYINEPILVDVANPVRYNQVYPRWAFDQYRELVNRLMEENAWVYLDLWNLIPQNEFADTDFHRTFPGETRMTRELLPLIQAEACKK